MRVHQIDASGNLSQEHTTASAFRAGLGATGIFDWGGENFGYASVETFGVARSERRTFHVVTDDIWVEVVSDSDGQSREINHTGSPPAPRYQSSPWTRLVQDTLEIVYDDPVLREWFGFRREVVDHPWVETVDEAKNLLFWRLDEVLSFQMPVELPWSSAAVGQTIRMIDPDQGIDARTLVDQVVYNLAPGVARQAALLRQPLLDHENARVEIQEAAA